MNVRVRIERLVLDGVSVEPSARDALRTSVEAELGRLLSEGGLSPRLLAGGAFAHARGAQVRLPPDAAALDIGRQVAHGLYGGIGR